MFWRVSWTWIEWRNLFLLCSDLNFLGCIPADSATVYWDQSCVPTRISHEFWVFVPLNILDTAYHAIRTTAKHREIFPFLGCMYTGQLRDSISGSRCVPTLFLQLLGSWSYKHSGNGIPSNNDNRKASSQITFFGFYTGRLRDRISVSRFVPTWFSWDFSVLRARNTPDTAYQPIRTTATTSSEMSFLGCILADSVIYKAIHPLPTLPTIWSV
jgi:hypothetical protein